MNTENINEVVDLTKRWGLNVKETIFQGVFILEPAVFHDNRGFFYGEL